jgi:putative hydrolase of HD superfamily
MTDVANDAEHVFRVIFIALILARAEGVKNEEKIIKMALVHDIAETRTNDHHYVQSVYTKRDEESATRDMFEGSILENLNSEYLKEYRERKTIEAKIVKDADNLDVDIELKEVEERGHSLPKKWKTTRKLILDKKLYTNSAKKLWKMLQKSDPADWHMKANKWIRVPEAGK